MGKFNLAGFQAEIDLIGIGLWIANVLIINQHKTYQCVHCLRICFFDGKTGLESV